MNAPNNCEMKSTSKSYPHCKLFNNAQYFHQLAFVCLIFLWYKLLTGISAFAQFFYSILAHFGAGIFCRLQVVNVG